MFRKLSLKLARKLPPYVQLEKKIQLLEKTITYYDVRVDRIYKSLTDQSVIPAPSGAMPAPLAGDWSEAALYKEAESLSLGEAPPSEDFASVSGEAAGYYGVHWKRLIETFRRLRQMPASASAQRVLEIGPSDFYQPALRKIFPRASFTYIGKPFINDTVAADPAAFHDIDLEGEGDWPIPGPFDVILAFEVIEHLFRDPMKLFIEANRLLAPGGQLVLTTPNLASTKALRALLTHHAPHCYVKFSPGQPLYVTHRTEFTMRDMQEFARAAGFTAEVGSFESYAAEASPMLLSLLRSLRMDDEVRGDTLYVTFTKQSAPVERYPAWFYV